MKDNAKGIGSVSANVCRIITKSAWGKVSPAVETDAEGVPRWQLIHDQLSWTRPTLLTSPEIESPEELVDYWTYLREAYPDGEGKTSDTNKRIREDRILSFAEKGAVGGKFRNTRERMMKALNLPKGAKEELNYPPSIVDKINKGEPLWDEEHEGDEESKKSGRLTDEQKNLLTMFGEGKYHLIPSFFRTLIFLKKQKREFSVLFRTFGEDLDQVVWEFNRFCNGQHPCYSGRNGTPLIRFDGSKGAKDLRIRNDEQKALFYRISNDLSDARLLQGTYNRESKTLDGLNDLLNDDAKYEDMELSDDVLVIYQKLMDTLKKYSSMAIQDDYPNWEANDRHREVAKLLLLDQGDYGTQHVFFDDNADEDEDCIVDARDVITKEVIKDKKMKDIYVIKVEPHRAILEPDYFIKMIEMAEQSRDDEIERVESGQVEDIEADPNTDREVQDEWGKLQSASNEEYLAKTILPVLYQGMKKTDLVRPDAPLEYLALFLLKH